MTKPFRGRQDPFTSHDKRLLVFLGIFILFPVFLPAEEIQVENKKAREATPGIFMEGITVTADRILLPTRQTDESVYTGTEVTAKGIETQGIKGKGSVYEALTVLPGISVESAEPYGLGAEQRTVRVRGVRGGLGALTVEGIPNYGGNPIGPRDYLYDLENIRSLSVYKGAVPGDIGTGVGSRGGAIVLKPLWPQEKTGLRFSQSFGSDAFHRTFLRIDSGALAQAETRVSASYSHAQADKWKGHGEIGPRKNANFSLSQDFGRNLDVFLWINHNRLDQHLFRPLDIVAARDLSTYGKRDFHSQRTGEPAEDILYFDYNKGRYKNTDILAVINARPHEKLRFTLKPYLAMEDSAIFEGSTAGGGQVQKRERDIDRRGLIGEGEWKGKWLTLAAGYLFEAASMEIASKKYAITPTGLAYRGYGVIATSGDTLIHSPYLKISGTMGKIDWQGGLKYFHFTDPAAKGYATDPADYSLKRAADLDRKSRDHSILLPTAGIGAKLSENLYLYGSYGKNFIRPYSYMPLINLYNNNRAAFQEQNIALDDLFAGYDMEESDSIDLGMRFSTSWFDFSPTLFYSRHRKLLTTVYDPRVDLAYQQNIGKASGYGLDLETNLYLHERLTLFFNPTWTVLEYDEDLTFQGSAIDCKGKQVVDTPLLMIRSGLIFNWKNLEIIPSVRYTGKRYGDIEHREKIGSHTTVDIKGSYTLENIFFKNEVKLALEMNNLLDKRYISGITASDDNRGGTASYYVGAPFSAVFTASVRF